jgi:hypothetical protein
MLTIRLTPGLRTRDRNHHQGRRQDVEQGEGQEELVDREPRACHRAVERSVEDISAVEPEDVDVGEHEQHRDPECGKHELHVDRVFWYCLAVVVLTGPLLSAACGPPDSNLRPVEVKRGRRRAGVARCEHQSGRLGITTVRVRRRRWVTRITACRPSSNFRR